MKKSMKEDHISCQMDKISTTEVDRDHQKAKHIGTDIGMMSLIGGTGMIITQTNLITAITTNSITTDGS